MSSQTVVIQAVVDALANWKKYGFDIDEANMHIEDIKKEFPEVKA